MADVFTKRKRSAVMSRIRSRGNKKTELALVYLLRETGITGWRRHQALFGKPDFVFPKQKLAVFVDGCFWHGCRWHCTYSRLLRSSRRPLRLGGSIAGRSGKAFWLAKLSANKRRDRLVNRTLRRHGWTVIRIWEHELAGSTKAVERIRQALQTVRQS